MQIKTVLSIVCAFCLAGVQAFAAEPTVADLITALKSGDQPAKLSAIDSIGQQGEKAAAAVPALTELLKDHSPEVRAHAVKALGEIGQEAKPAVPALAALIADKDENVRRMVIGALRRIRPGPQVGIPLFIKIMDDPDPAVKIRAMQALSSAGKDAVPFLISALKDEKAAYWACLILDKIGPDAEQAVPELTQLVNSKRPELSREAILSLAAIGKPAAPAIPQLVKAMDNDLDREPAVYALGQIGISPGSAESKIRSYTNSPDKTLGIVSIWTLARFHPEDVKLQGEAVTKLFEGLKNDEPAVRILSAKALAALRPGPAITLPIMDKALAGADEKVVHGALDALATLGPAAIPSLIEATKYEKVRPYAIYILGQNGPAAKSAVDTLVKYIDDKNPDVQNETLVALAKIGPEAKSAVPALIKVLEKNEGSVCCASVYALGSIGPEAKAAAPTLQKNLSSNDETLALLSAWALANIEPKDAKTANEVVPLMIRGLANPNPKFRLGAAECLKKYGSLAKAAVPALKQASQDSDAEVRKVSAEALKAIGS